MIQGRDPADERTGRGSTSRQDAVVCALSFLERDQDPSGEFPTWSSQRGDSGALVREYSVFITSHVLFSLRFAPGELAQALRCRGIDFIARQAVSPGIWPFWTHRGAKRVPPDIDDTCCCSFELKDVHPHIAGGVNRSLILSNRNEDGLFSTWFGRSPGAGGGDVDAVVNANALLYLGEGSGLEPVVDHVNVVLGRLSERVANESVGSPTGTGAEMVSAIAPWYLDPTAVFYAASRAFFNGVTGLAPGCAKLLQVLTDAPVDSMAREGRELATALEICALRNLECADTRAICSRLDILLSSQREDGSWPRRPFFQDPIRRYGSESLTTGFCVEALARCLDFPAR